MYFALYLIYSLINEIGAMHISLEENETTSSCIENLIRILFDQNSPIYYIKGEENFKYVFHSRQTYIYHYKKVRKHSNRNYIIVSKNYNELKKMLNFLSSREKLWNARASFIISLKNEDNIKKIFEEILKADLRKFVLITRQNKIYLLDPYDEENLCGMYAKNIFSTTCDALKYVKFFKKITNIQNCNFTFLIHNNRWPYPYVIYRNLTELSVYNFPLELLRTKFGLNVIYDIVEGDIDTLNEENSLSLEKILNNSIDSRAGELHYGYGTNGQDYVEITDIFNYDPNYWIVLKPNQMSNVQILGYIFSEIIWVSILFIFILVVIFTYFVMKKTEDRSEITNLVLKIFSINLGMGLERMPKARASKILLFSFTLYSFHLVCFYQGILSSILTSPVYERGINNMEELANSDDVVIYEHAVYIDLLSHSKLPFISKLQEKAKIHGQTNINYLELVVKWRNISTTYSKLLLDVSPYADKIRIIGDLCMPATTLYYAMRRGHPLYELLNGVIVVINEHGFYQPWLNYITRKKFNSINQEKEIVLTTDHILGAVYILFGGYVLALFIFIVEVINYTLMIKIKF